MIGNNESRGSTATLSKESPSTRVRDGRTTTRSDTDEPRGNNDSQLRRPTHGIAAFLWETDPSTPVEELGDRYREWCDDTEQTDATEWSA